MAIPISNEAGHTNRECLMSRGKKPKDTFDLTLSGHPPLKPKTARQSEYLRAISTHDMVVATGPAGSGKTFIPSAVAAERLATGQIDRVILTRPTVPIDNEALGFLPGDINKKMEPWTAPILDVFRERIGVQLMTEYLKEKRIDIVPFAFMRGRTFKDAMVIVDEAQNMTIRQAKALVTRIGEQCIYSINGDLNQSDLQGPNGLEWILETIERTQLDIPVIRFVESDVVRSRLCRQWVEAIKTEPMFKVPRVRLPTLEMV